MSYIIFYFSTKTCTTQSAEGSQFDPKDVFGSIRNSTAQTDMTCICSSDRIRHLSARISAVEMRLGIPDRSSNLPQSSGILERLAHILTRIGIIESYLKRLRFVISPHCTSSRFKTSVFSP